MRCISVTILLGLLGAHVRKGRESATFEYDPGWFENVDRFSLEPALTQAEIDRMASAFEHEDLKAAGRRSDSVSTNKRDH